MSHRGNPSNRLSGLNSATTRALQTDAIGASLRCNRNDRPEITFIGSMYMESSSITTTERSFGMPTGSVNNIFTLRTSGAQIAVASTDTNDTSAGTGARTLNMSGLDDNYNTISEVIILNGQTEVLTASSSWMRINKIFILTAGSGGNNAGDIYFGAVGDFTLGMPQTDTYGAVITGFNNSSIGIFTVPVGHTFEYTRGNVYTTASSTKPAVIRETGWFDGGQGGDPANYLNYQIGNLGTSSDVSYDFSGAAGYPEKSALDLRVFTETGNITSMVLYYEFILCENAKANN